MTPPRRWSITLRTAIALAVVVLLGYGAYRVYYTVQVEVHDSYAQWWAADMVIEYMEENRGHWPSNWEDLSEPYEAIATKAGKPWTFAEIRDRVEIRFDVDPQALRTAALIGDQPPFDVVYLRSGERHHWSGKEPNRMIWDYLHEASPRTVQDAPATQVDRP